MKRNRKEIRKQNDEEEPPYLVFKSLSEDDDEEIDIRLSNGLTQPNQQKNSQKYAKAILDSLKRATGTKDSALATQILWKVAEGSKYQKSIDQLNNAAALLAALKPQDETEALLLGQFLNLQDCGNKFLHLAHTQDGFYHLERYSILAAKLLNIANQTMQTLLKYRSRGQQVVQVVHLHNGEGGKAIVAQNLSPQREG